MPRFSLKAKDQKTFEKLEKAVQETVIIQGQKSLAYGHWDFVVFAPAGKKETMLRVGYAEYATIQRAPLYIASLGEPGLMNMNSVPIEEFLSEDDVPEEYQGLEIYQVDPVRPLNITEKKTLGPFAQAADKICKEYETQNIAVIQAPRESDWLISVMKYLNECDQNFPDQIQQTLQSKISSANGGGRSSPEKSSRLLN